MREEAGQERRGPESSAEGTRAAASRETAGESTPGGAGERPEGVLTLVCLTCGKEYFFDADDPPPNLKCEKCGNGVFRSFFEAQDDEAAQDFRDSTDRDTDTDQPSTDIQPGDLLDLDRQ